MIDLQLQLDLGTSDALLAAELPLKTRPKTRRAPLSKLVAFPDAKAMAARLACDSDYRVLHRLAPTYYFDRVAQGSLVRVLVLDTETTGLDHSCDKIIELAMLRLDVDSVTGCPVGEVLVYDGLEDPGVAISKEVEAITGISNAMVQGQRLDELRIAAMLEDIDLVIAHNAGFDRPFCEARIPTFAQLPWGCSFADIDWKKEGHGTAKLEYLAMEKGWFYDAHRAEVDCHALLAILTEQLPASNQTGLAKIIAASGAPSFKLQASGAPFEVKDLLKARGYRWNAALKVWVTRLANEAQLTAECEWLRAAVYGGFPARVQVEKSDARMKYSNRIGELSSRQI